MQPLITYMEHLETVQVAAIVMVSCVIGAGVYAVCQMLADMAGKERDNG